MGMRKPTKSLLTKKLDIAFSLLIRKRGHCERCGTTKNLQCSHIYSRANRSVRWSEENAFCLCSGCHFAWHKNPLESIEWMKTRIGEQNAARLILEAHRAKKWTVPEMESLLEEIKGKL